MDKIQIKDYISKYRNSYSKDSIKSQLINSGAKVEDIDSIYSEISGGRQLNNSGKNGKSGLALALVLIGFFIPLIGFFMIIAGIVLAHKSRKIKKDGMSISALIIGYFVIVLQVLFIVSLLMFSFVDFGSLLPNNVELINQIDSQSTSSGRLTSEMVEASGIVYIKNYGSDVKVNVEIGNCSGTFNVVSGLSNDGYKLVGCNLISGSNVDVIMKTSDSIFRETEIVS